jgi:CRP-like cAMP-binding protein
MKIDISCLRQIPLFAALDEDDLAYVATLTTEHHYGRNEIIMLEGDVDGAFYYVCSGLIKAYRISTEGKEQILRLIAGGSTFNDVSALDGGPNPANIAAVETSTVYTIKGSEILMLIVTRPHVALAAVRTLASRLRHTVSLASDLSLHRTSARIAKTLLEQQELNSPLPTTHRLTQQEIAALAGTAREVVGRALKLLEVAGIVDARYGHVIVLNRDRLALFAEGASDQGPDTGLCSNTPAHLA